MENSCPQCEEIMYLDNEYKGALIYMCANKHRSAFIDERGNNVPVFKTEVADHESNI